MEYLNVLNEALAQINELKISKTSEIRKKFVKLVKDKFVDGNGTFVMELEEDEEEIVVTPNDIQAFFKYGLIVKNGNEIKLTPKGVACAVGVEVDTNGDGNIDAEELKSFVDKEFAPEKALKLKNWITGTTNGENKYTKTESW